MKVLVVLIYISAMASVLLVGIGTGILLDFLITGAL